MPIEAKPNPYPKLFYRPDEAERVIRNADEERQLGPGWQELNLCEWKYR